MPGPTLAISSKRYLQMIQKLTPVGTWSWDPATGQMAWSDVLHEMLGTDPTSGVLTQDDIVRRTHPDDRWIIEEKMRGQGAVASKAMRLRGRDGSYRWHLWHQEIIDRGGPTIVIGVAHDIHDSYSAHNLLDERQRILDTLTNLLGIILWRSDANGCLNFDNGWCEFTGTTFHDNRDQGWERLLHPDDRDDVLAAWANALKTLRPYAASYRLRRADGNYVVMETQAAPLFDPSGRVLEWVGCSIPTARELRTVPKFEQGRPTSRELKAARALLGLTVRQLAEESGVSVATINRFEGSDDVHIRESNLVKVRDALAARGATFTWDKAGKRTISYDD